MLAELNVSLMVISSLLFLYFYVKSVGPAALEQKMGEAAYRRCGWYRIIASVFEFLVVIGYIIYVFNPLPISLPHTFPWAWWISVIVALVLGVPGGYSGIRRSHKRSKLRSEVCIIY
jgi:hypothetical protein